MGKSAWSKIFNSKINVTMLNMPDNQANWFHNEEIWDNQYQLAADQQVNSRWSEWRFSSSLECRNLCLCKKRMPQDSGEKRI